MATPTWPTTLPAFVLVQGYGEQYGNNSIETPVDVGPAKVRRRYTGRNRMFTVSIDVTVAQSEAFDTFYETTLAFGSIPFLWVHPRTQVASTLRFRLPPPKLTMLSNSDYVIQMNLEKMS